MLCWWCSARVICFCGKGGSWWQSPSFMRFHRLETGTGLLSWADPWRGAYRCPQSDSCALKKRNRVSFGSDAPCTSLDPILWIHKSVNHSNPSERVPVRSAVRMATWKEPMQLSRRSIEEGKIADMVILSENPYNVPFESIKNIRVECLILGGGPYYSAVRPLIPCIWHALTTGGKYWLNVINAFS